MGLFDLFRKKNAGSGLQTEPELKIEPTPKTGLPADVLRMRGRVLLEEAEYDEAVETLLQAAEMGDAESAYLAAKTCADYDSLLLEEAECISWFTKAAEGGYALAQYQLGEYYIFGGCGLPEDEEQAFYWYAKAAEQGMAPAMRGLGTVYSGRGETQEAALWYARAYEAGDKEAMYELGILYRYAEDGGTHNAERAITALTAAADAGNGQAMYELGDMYEHGDGVGQDMEKAMDWYKKGARKSCAAAQYALGMCYLLGTGGIREDLTLAFLWMHRAADKDYPEAVFRLAQMYRSHVHVAKNAETEVYWLDVASLLGCEEARELRRNYHADRLEGSWSNIQELKQRAQDGNMNALEGMIQRYFRGESVSKSIETAVDWVLRAAEWEKRIPADEMPYNFQPGWYMYWAGIYCMTGFGMGTYREKAGVEWLELAAERGYPPAMYMIGEIYRLGHHVEQDFEVAAEWYEEGAEAGDAQSLYALAIAHLLGEGVEKDRSRYFALMRKAAEAGHGRANYVMCMLLSKGLLKGRPDEATLYEQRAHELGDAKIEQYYDAIRKAAEEELKR